MSMLEIHAEALSRVSAAYHEFLLKYKANEKIVYGLVEGKEDPMFYRGLIERALPDGWEVELVRSGRKTEVIKAIQAFDWERFSRSRICFFVDRDLSDFVPDESIDAQNLYVTDNYSIENDVVNFHTFRRILEEVLGIADFNGEELEKLRTHFGENLKIFQEALLPVMVQIVLWRKGSQRPNLDEIKVKELFQFSDGRIFLRDQYKLASERIEHAAKCVNVKSSDAAELAAMDGGFRAKNGGERFVRGKYLLWFLVEFSGEIHRVAGKFCAKCTTPPKIKVGMGVANAMVIVAPRTRPPASLVQFIQKNYLRYIRDESGIGAVGRFFRKCAICAKRWVPQSFLKWPARRVT